MKMRDIGRGLNPWIQQQLRQGLLGRGLFPWSSSWFCAAFVDMPQKVVEDIELRVTLAPIMARPVSVLACLQMSPQIVFT
jgi:hypothetical protein